MSVDDKRILVTGASGYIGSLLLERLAAAGHHARAMLRKPQSFTPPDGDVQVVEGDVLQPRTLTAALQGISVAYYLIHAMGAGKQYAQRDRDGAINFARAAREAGVGKIVYLGGLGSGDSLSAHLASRQEVGRILRESGVPCVEFRAAVVIGAGSLSFDMVRALVERLPLMVTPRWVRVPTQPIAVDDVLAYLAAALEPGAPVEGVFEIGGADRTSYLGIMRHYARKRGLRRLFIPVPVLTPSLSSLWLKLVTPLHAKVGRELIEGVRNPTVVQDESALETFDVRPAGIEAALDAAMKTDRLYKREVRSLSLPVEPKDAFAPVCCIGGQTGWYYANWMWRLRGALDRLVGGPGLRRDCIRGEVLQVGDQLDFWRVEEFVPDRLLRLRAEMKLPGTAFLQFEALPENGNTTLRQTALFDPRGLGGRLYWALMYPFHKLIFSRMLKRIATRAGLQDSRR